MHNIFIPYLYSLLILYPIEATKRAKPFILSLHETGQPVGSTQFPLDDSSSSFIAACAYFFLALAPFLQSISNLYSEPAWPESKCYKLERISSPFKGCGAGGAAIYSTHLVLTSSDPTKLLAFSSDRRQTWRYPERACRVKRWRNIFETMKGERNGTVAKVS